VPSVLLGGGGVEQLLGGGELLGGMLPLPLLGGVLLLPPLLGGTLLLPGGGVAPCGHGLKTDSSKSASSISTRQRL
jgi:hypothetical protein